MKTKHTPEPWAVNPLNKAWYGVKNTPHNFTNLGMCKLRIDYYPESQANAARIVACVNACAGMENPAAEISALRERIAELEAKSLTKPQPNWDEAPEWAQWWAVDENGEEWWYEIKPVALASCWASYERERKKDATDLNSFDWRETLTHRP